MLASGLDPDRDEARRLLAEELAQPEYNQLRSVISRIQEWLFQQLSELLWNLSFGSGLTQLLLAVVIAAAIAVAVYAVRGTRRQARLSDRGRGAVLEDPTLTAADYRARVSAALRSGDWDVVLLDSYRAIAASADERVLLDDLPGRTAHEVAVALAPRFPEHRRSLAEAADHFDEVRYGDRHATQQQAESVRALDSTLARARPQHVVMT